MVAYTHIIIGILLCSIAVPVSGADDAHSGVRKRRFQPSGSPSETVGLLSDVDGQDQPPASQSMMEELDGKQKDKKDSEPKTQRGGSQNYIAQSLFTWEAREGNVEKLKTRLQDPGVDVNGYDSNGWTAVHWATRNGHDACVDILLKKKADPNIQTTDTFNTALTLVSKNKKSVEITQLLLDNKADPNIRNKKGYSALIKAASSGNPERVNLLLKAQADVTCSDKKGYTSLHYATDNDQKGDCMRLLLAKKANVHAKNKDGRTALCFCTTIETTQILVDAGAVVTQEMLDETAEWYNKRDKSDSKSCEERKIVYEFFKHIYKPESQKPVQQKPVLVQPVQNVGAVPPVPTQPARRTSDSHAQIVCRIL